MVALPVLITFHVPPDTTAAPTSSTLDGRLSRIRTSLEGSAGRGGRNRDRVAILLADSCGRGDWRGFRQGAWHLHCDGGDVARLAQWSRSVNVGVVAHAGPYFVARVGAGQACLVPDHGAVR